MYLLISFRKSTPPQKVKLIVYYYWLRYSLDGFVGELTFQHWLMNELCQVKPMKQALGGGLSYSFITSSFLVTDMNNELTNLCGNWLLRNVFIRFFCEIQSLEMVVWCSRFCARVTESMCARVSDTVVWYHPGGYSSWIRPPTGNWSHSFKN